MIEILDKHNTYNLHDFIQFADGFLQCELIIDNITFTRFCCLQFDLDSFIQA